jgi:hypothetical protein
LCGGFDAVIEGIGDKMRNGRFQTVEDVAVATGTFALPFDLELFSH